MSEALSCAAIRSFRGEIRTGRLRLRLRRPSDDETLFALFNSWQVVRFLSGPTWPVSRDSIRAHLSDGEARREAGTELHLVIDRDGTPIGAIDWRMRGASAVQSGAGPNIGYWLGEPFWGRGYMREAAGALCDAIFERTAADCIFSGAMEGNAASLKLQQRLGFVVESRSTLYSNPRRVEWPHVNTVLARARRAITGAGE